MKPFNNLINAKTREAISQNTRIKHVISKIVPASSVAHIEFCRIEGGRLRVTVDNSAWVAKLRFSEKPIIKALRAEKLDVHTASWHVSAAEKPQTRVILRKPNELSLRSVAALKALADATSENEDERRSYACSAVKNTDDGGKLRQELLKLAAKLKE